jgi:hypothetical protein
MDENKKQLPQFSLFVPSDHDIVLKVIPSKEFFEKRNDEQGSLVFSLDEKTKIINEAREGMLEQFAEKLDSMGRAMPVELLMVIAQQYAKIRGLKGKIIIKDGNILIGNPNKPTLSIRLYHALDVLCSAPKEGDKEVQKRELKTGSKVVGKIDKKRIERLRLGPKSWER